jgi:hypothetical protein
LKVLGINRRPKPVSSLEDYVREKYGNRNVGKNEAGAAQDGQDAQEDNDNE